MLFLLNSKKKKERERGIGFLDDKRRMNVALTRAKNNLFVIGNEQTLSTDNIWKQLVQHAKDTNRSKKFFSFILILF